MEFRLLGPLEAWKDGLVVTVGGAKQRALLAILLLHANEVVPRDLLMEELWSDRPPGTAGPSLDHQVSRLRKALGPSEMLATRPGGYVLQVDREQVDVYRFERLLEEGRRANAAGNPADALAALQDALALWRGGALAEFAYEPFARLEIERLEELRLVATEERLDAELALGRHGPLVAELESLAAKHPLRERLCGQLMLALYRSGRQAEALRVYANMRRRLVDELGLEPSQALQQLQQAILRQDPTLDLVSPETRTRRRQRTVAAALGLTVVAGVAAVGVLLAHGGTQSSHAEALAEPDSVALVAAKTGEVVGQVRAVRAPVFSRFGEGALWNVSVTGQLNKIDPATGEVGASLNTGVASPCGLAVGAGSLWVTDCSSATLVRIDPMHPVVVGRVTLPTPDPYIASETGEVTVGAGSVWVAHGIGNPAWVERLDPQTGRVQKHILIPEGGAQRLAFGDGALWVAGDVDAPEVPKLSRIDPRTNKVTPSLSSFHKSVCCIAVGGGFVWAATTQGHTIWKIGEDGTFVGSVNLAADPQNLTYADGAVWAADGDAGTIVRIDPTTDKTRTYRLGHNLQGVAVRDGILAVGVQSSAQDVTAGLHGHVAHVALSSNSLDWGPSGTDPVGTINAFDGWQVQYQYATCAKLLNYPDASGDAGKRLVPEVAAAWPSVTDGGRTYTFRIRTGYGFSPPSNESVTAESFRHEIERVLKDEPGSPYAAELSDVVGAQAYTSGKATHVSGISADRNTLVIHLVKPTPDLPRLLALPQFCAVPASLPTVGLPYPIPTAGPYYLWRRGGNAVVLKPNPNYHGPREHRLDAIVYRFNVDVAKAVAGVAQGKVDYVEEDDPALAPRTASARAAGTRYGLTPNNWTEGLVLNTRRQLFSDVRLRRAVAYALDRSDLAAAVGAIPTSRVLPPSFPGFDDGPGYPLRPDLRTARRLAAGRHFPAVFAVQTDDAGALYDASFVRGVRTQLAAIGIKVTLLTWRQSSDPATVASVLDRADLVRRQTNGADAFDPAQFLRLSRAYQYLPAADRKNLERIATFSSPHREAAAAALAAKLQRDAVYVGFGYRAVPELMSKRLGCVVRQPEYPGLDLAALCLRR